MKVRNEKYLKHLQSMLKGVNKFIDEGEKLNIDNKKHNIKLLDLSHLEETRDLVIESIKVITRAGGENEN